MTRSDSAGVIAPPPLIFGGAVALGLVLQRVHALPLFRGNASARIAGGALVLAGLALSAAIMREFGRAGTPVTPWSETRRLVVTGPYRYSRNPDYVGQALVTAGLALLLGSAWMLIALVPALVLVRHGVIGREERYLERKFGEEYRRYRARVGRWV